MARDLEQFKPKMPWDERLKLIQETFPSTVELDWHQAFNDIEMFGRVIRDILKVDQAPTGRSGPRPMVEHSQARIRLRQFMGREYSEDEFIPTFKALAAGRSYRHLATKTGLDRNMIRKLMNGEREPDAYIMETIARSFGKEPSFFLEYRIAYVLCGLAERLVGQPEATVDLFRMLRREAD